MFFSLYNIFEIKFKLIKANKNIFILKKSLKFCTNCTQLIKIVLKCLKPVAIEEDTFLIIVYICLFSFHLL